MSEIKKLFEFDLAALELAERWEELSRKYTGQAENTALEHRIVTKSSTDVVQRRRLGRSHPRKLLTPIQPRDLQFDYLTNIYDWQLKKATGIFPKVEARVGRVKGPAIRHDRIKLKQLDRSSKCPFR